MPIRRRILSLTGFSAILILSLVGRPHGLFGEPKLSPNLAHPSDKIKSDNVRSLVVDRVKPGNETFCASFPDELVDKRLGLVINQTSVLPGGAPLLEKLLADGRQVTAIFTPEHGLQGMIEGGEKIGDDRWKNIKVFSLYGKEVRPTSDELENVDALVYDIQDVGTRFYTYITTLKYILEAAGQAGVPVYILDRPNPLGGRLVEGPLLKKKFESFIAALPVPTRYGLTAGELALMMKGEGWVDQTVDLHVIPVSGWRRGQTWRDTGLPWIPTSPNIPTPESALAYPGIGLFGGIALNQGLGTDLPFLQFGAPWLDPEAVVRAWPGRAEAEFRLEPVSYTPLAIPEKALTPPFRDRLCRGLRLHIVEPENFHSVHFALTLIKILKDLYPEKITAGTSSLVQMFGDETLDLFIRGKLPYEELLRLTEEDESAFREQRKKYLLYGD
jgi:uncharacterized protein YbbC (DUF1343 family)